MMMNAPLQPASIKRDNVTGMRCQNKSGEEMPAFAACVVTGETDGIYRVTKPSEDSAKEVLFGPPNAVPNDGYFTAVSPYDELVKYNGSVSPGDEVGTVSGQWYVETGKTGFAVLSGSGGVARVRPFSGGLSSLVEINVPAHDTSVSLSGGAFSWDGAWQTLSSPVNVVERYATLGATQFKLTTLAGSYTSSGGIYFRLVGGASDSIDLFIKAELKYSDGTTVESYTPGSLDNDGLGIQISSGGSNLSDFTFTANFLLEDKQITEFRLTGYQTSSSGYSLKRIRISNTRDSVSGPVPMTFIPFGISE